MNKMTQLEAIRQHNRAVRGINARNHERLVRAGLIMPDNAVRVVVKNDNNDCDTYYEDLGYDPVTGEY